jgi:Leucine-rich repeat (LRR) protein
MKKITLFTTALFLCFYTVYGQLTNIPDANFEQALIDIGLDTGPVDGSVATANISSVTSLNVFNRNISDLTGIEDFAALETLVCNANQLTSLDLSQNTQLQSLLCTANQLTSLDLTNNTALLAVSCNNNNISSLSLNNSIEFLNCSGNNLSSLNLSNFTNLEDLRCAANNLNSININNCAALTKIEAGSNLLNSIDLSTNTNLLELDLNNNALNSLDVSPNTALTFIDCRSNNLQSLDFSNNPNLTDVDCRNNDLISFDMRNGNNTAIAFNHFFASNNPNLFCISVDDVSYAESTWDNNIDPQTVFELDCNATTFIPDDNFEQALIDLGLDSGPLDDFVLTTVISNITTLDVSNRGIVDFTGINAFTSLIELNVSQNPITQSITFFINDLTNLEVLSCAINELDNLDISGNTNLRELNCNANDLTSLDISNNTSLEILYCDSNNITTLNTANNTLLNELRISSNPITSLDLSNNSALEDLRCTMTNLTDLDLTNNSALTQVSCANSQLTSLDFSNNVLLTTIQCQNNSLTSLDLRNGNNTNLTQLLATNNPNLDCISVDDVAYAEGNFTNIDSQTSFSIDCNVPQTAIPDINFELALISFGFDTAPANGFVPTDNINSVTTLPFNNRSISDLTGIEDFTALESLTISNNSLQTVDLSNNLALTSLVCFGNNLIALDVSNNTALEVLVCSNNVISTLDLSNNPALTNINCSSNELTELNVANGNNTVISNQFFNATNNSNLTCIEVDDVTFATNNWFNIDVQTEFSENCSTLGTANNTISEKSITLYPNPTSDLAYVNIPSNHSINKITIIDSVGRVVKTQSNGSNKLELSSFNPGIYYIILQIGNQSYTKKLIVN